MNHSSLLPWAAVACLTVAAAPAQAGVAAAGQVWVLVSQAGGSLRGLSILLDGADIASTDASGAASLSASPGEHQLRLMRGTLLLAEIGLRLSPGEAAEWLVKLPAEAGGVPGSRLDVFSAAAPGTGSLSGYVTDELGNPVAGAALSVVGANIGGSSNAEGYFELKVPRGVWDLSVSHPGKSLTRTFNAQRVSPNLDAGVNLALTERRAAPTGAGIEEVVATARYVPDTSTALERSSDSVLDVISSQEIAIAGDSDAAAALTRVTGVTIINDLVFVRGLGDRYSAAYVNRSEVPSPDPSRRAISLDLFPTDLIKGISVQKTYSADLPADFSGGAVLIETQGIPEEFNFSFGSSLGGNSRSTGQDGLSYDGGDSDWLGNDDGTREIPTLAASLTDGGRIPLQSLSAAQREVIGESLANIWDVEPEKMGPDVGTALSVGNRFDRIPGLGQQIQTGFQFSALYDQKTRFRAEERKELALAAGGPRVASSETQEHSAEGVDTALIGSFSASYDERHSLDYSAFQTRQTTKNVSYSEGLEDGSSTFEFRRYTLDWVENDLIYQQLRGSHEFEALGGLKLGWQGGSTQAKSDVLDRRQYQLQRAPGSEDRYTTQRTGSDPRRSWEFLDEQTDDLGADLTLPLSLTSSLTAELKAGLRHTDRDRDYRLVRWRYTATNPGRDVLLAIRNSSIENILTPEFIRPGDGWELANATSLTPEGNADSYQGDHQISAHYGAVKLSYDDRYELELGARQEESKLGVRSVGNDGQVFGDALLDTDDLLPAATAAWFIGDEQQVRAGYSRTVNRPQFRELADVSYRDPESGLISFGNPNLLQADVTNYDLRYEYYWNGAEGVTAAAFLKEFDNPIEVQLRTNADGSARRTFGNAGQAEVYGVELDGRWELDEFADLSEILGSTYVSGNLSLIESEVDVSDDPTATRDKRPLQGQSPWIVNFTLGYSNIGTETDIALLLNVFGERIVEAGFNGLPDAEEQPAPTLDFNLKQTLRSSWKLGFKLRNLLDPNIEVTQGSEIQRRYKLGTSYSLSVEYSF